MKKPVVSRIATFIASLLLGLCSLSCSEKPANPDFFESEWKAMSVVFCTENTAREVWQTRDKDKLELLQGALTIENPRPLDHVIKSHNHAVEIELATEQGGERWQLVINRDQSHVSFYQVSNPLRSFTAESDAMFYRAMNTLLKSLMSESVDIFRQCELAEQ